MSRARRTIAALLPPRIAQRGRLLAPYLTWTFARQLAKVYRNRLMPSADEMPTVHAPLLPSASELETLFMDSAGAFASFVRPVRQELTWGPLRLYNGYFESVDAGLYYCVVRKTRPHRIVEVGSGACTRFGLEALARNRRGRILSIDPQPRRRLPREVMQLRSRVGEVDPKLFGQLGAGDILFIDSSHTTQEATYHVESILPLLRPGVLVHHHDFFFPFALYHEGNGHRYGEPDVLLDFYAHNRDSYEILTSASYLRYSAPRLLTQLISSFSWFPERVPGSLWTRKVA